MLKNFINSTVTLVLFLISAGCFYGAFALVFASPLINIFLVIIAVYVFLQACGIVDKKMEIGPYSEDKKGEDGPPKGGGGPVML